VIDIGEADLEGNGHMEEPTKWRLAVASAALAGAAVGAVALGPSLASAQNDDSTTTTTEAESGTTDTTDSTDSTDGTDTAAEDCEPGEGGAGHRGFGRGPGLDAAAEAIGIEASALRDALVSGQTIAEVAEANGVAVADVVAAMVADAQEHLAQAVADGHLTQEEADERAADLEERITALVNGELEFGFPGGPGGPGRHGGPWGERPDADTGTDS
jgi:hypothetical protein